MDAASKARTESKRMFTRTANALKGMLSRRPVVTTLERRLVDLKMRWNIVQEKHETFISNLEEDANIEEEDKWIDEIDFKYYELESFVDKMIEEKKEEHRDEKRAVPESYTKPENSIKIEHLKFKSFNGDLRKYPRFKEEFNVHIKPMCTEVQLPLVLKSYLSEEVREDVENIGDRIDEIWERLDKKIW